MLNQDANSNIVQAFPIHSATFIGVATNEPCSKKIVHMAGYGDITFHFTTGDIVFTGVTEGADFSVAEDCTGVTSNTTVWIG